MVDDEKPTQQPELSATAARAIADKVIDAEQTVPKKIPAMDDVEAQEKAISGALASALLTATDLPITTLRDVLAPVAKQMTAYGIRQTEHHDPEAQYTPAWITDGARQEAVVLPQQAAHTEAEPVEARTAEAPSCPSRITKAAKAVPL